MISPSSTSRPARTSSILPGLPGARRTRSPFFWTTVLLGSRMARPQPRLFAHVPDFAMHRHQDFRPQPAIKRLEFGPPGCPRDVDQALPVGDERDVRRGQPVLDAADGDLVAGDLAAGKQHDIARFQGDRVIDPRRSAPAPRAVRPARRSPRSALRRAAGHRRVEIDRVGQVLEIARGLAGGDDPVERAPGNAQLAVGLRARPRPASASRATLEAKVVTSTRRPWWRFTSAIRPRRTSPSEPEPWD
jgi:hypothetical protein